jgi:hypothetical protein
MASVEKEILTPAVALRRVTNTAEDAKENQGVAGSKGATPTTPPKYYFVKNFGVMDKLSFPDGTKFQFRLIERNTGGYASQSFVETNDEKLASNLRAASKNRALGIMQIR